MPLPLRCHLVFALAFALALSACASLTPPPPDATPIGTIQGDGPSSPRLGDEVTVAGVLTADFSAGLGLWALQDAGDGNPATSDAIFLAGVAGPARVGDHLRVRGRVTERDTGKDSRLTVLEATRIERLPAAPRPPARMLQTAPADAAAWEAMEAMQVALPPDTMLVGSQNAARFGEWQVAFGGRVWTPTEVALPGAAANALARDNRARLLWLDDGDARERADTPMRRLIPRTGSRLEAVEGIVDEGAGRYRVQLASAPRVDAAPRPAPPARVGDVRIAAMNLENLFNGDGRGGGFPTERGAKTEAGYLHQRAKLVAALAGLDADVIALMELENDGNDPLSSEAQLIAALNAVQGGDWRAVPMPANASTDAIRVGLIYRATRVTPVGASATLDAGPFAGHSRPPLLQSFRAGEGPAFAVIATHFKSKGCRDAQGADADQRDGQSCWNATRLDSARRLDGWLRERLGGELVTPAVVLGDFNAYAMEDPPRWLRATGWRDAFATTGAEHPYSYVYDGQAGRLDHALLTPALAARLAGAAEWHINADEPDVPESPEAAVTPFRSSDHDPLVVDLRLRGR